MSWPVKTVDRHSSLDSFLTFICLIVKQRKSVGIKTSESSVLFEQPLSNFVDSQFFSYRKQFGMLMVWGLQSEQDILQDFWYSLVIISTETAVLKSVRKNDYISLLIPKCLEYFWMWNIEMNKFHCTNENVDSCFQFREITDAINFMKESVKILKLICIINMVT